MLRNTFLAQRQSLKLFERSPTCAATKPYTNQRAGSTVAVRATPNEPTNQRPDFSGHAPESKYPIRQFMRVLDQWRGRREKKDTQFLLQCTPVLKPYMAGFSKFRLLTDRLIMSENPEYALDALTFAEDLGLHHRHTTYEFYCYHLTAASNWKLVLRTVDLAIQNTGSCSPGLLNRRTRALLELSQYRKLDGMYQEFQAYGHKPDRITFHLLLTGYIRNNSLESARRCLQLMQESGFEMNAATHAIIACAYRNLGIDHSIEEKALENLPEMAQSTRVSVLNNILRAHLDDSNIQKALRILSLFDPQSVQVPVDVLFGNATGGGTARSPHHFQMPPVSLSHPPTPNASTFAILIHFCSSKDNFGGTLQLLHCMMSQGIVPSAQVITAMVHACFVGKRPDLAVQLVAGTCDSHATPRSLFDLIYSGSWDGPCFEIHVPDIKPNVQIFNSLLQGVLPLYGLDGAMEVLHIMAVNKVFPNDRTLDLTLSHVDVVEKAHPGTLINLLLKVTHKIPPTPTHLRIILRCIIRHEKHLTHSLGWLSWRYWETAKPGYPREDTPQSKDLDLFAGIKFPEFRRWDILSRPLFNALDKQGYKADFETFSMRIRYEAVIRRDPEAAHQIFNAMIARGLQPNAYHYGALMEGYTLVGNTKAAHHVLDAAKKAGVNANATLYTILMTSYARRRKPRGAMRVFRQMLEDGVPPDVPSIDVVTGAWYAIGAGTMAKRLLISLWEYVESFPFNLADKPLTELANHFRGLHNKPGYKTTIMSPARRLQLLAKLQELVGDLNTTIEDNVSLDDNFVVSKLVKVSEATLGVDSSRGGTLVRKGFRRTHADCNYN